MSRIAALVASAALVLAACGASGEVAASIDGTDITVDEVEELAPGEELTPDQFAQVLGALIQWTATEAAAEADFDYAPSADDVQAELDTLLAAQGVTVEEFAETQRISTDGLRRAVAQVLIQREVTSQLEATVDEPSDDAVAAELTGNAAAWTEVCVAHVLVESEEEAAAVLERIDGGEAFADVATEVSIDQSAASGGDLGCAAPTRYVGPFAEVTMTAPVGEAVGPVQSEFGFHVIVVNERTEPSEEELRTALREQALLEATNAWYLAALTAAEVTVDEEYGTWVLDPAPQVVAPS